MPLSGSSARPNAALLLAAVLVPAAALVADARADEPAPAPAPAASPVTSPNASGATPVADPEGAPPDGLEAAIKNGKIKLNINARLGFADFDNGTDAAFAPTVRTRLGYETAPVDGFVGYLEFENVKAVDDDSYNSTQNGVTDHAVIADVEVTEVNQAWVAWTAPEKGALAIKAGRQVIALDDQRFIGHVGWRQDQQTFDAVRFTTDAGVDNLELTAGYLAQVNRIFGEEADFDSESFFVNAGYGGQSQKSGKPKFSAFVYGLDLEAAALSSLTIGARVQGAHALGEGKGSLLYAASVATQSDYGDNPNSYDALYYFGDLGYKTADLGTIGAGIEVLGSDDGVPFTTPLATLHKFNGFADVFLATPADGLVDVYAYYALPLPKESKATAKIIGHFFQTEDGNDDLGWELDAVSTYKLTDNVKLLAKFAYFDGEEDGGPFDRTRFTLDLNYSF